MQHLLSAYYVPDTTVGVGNTTLNKTDISALIHKTRTVNMERLNYSISDGDKWGGE